MSSLAQLRMDGGKPFSTIHGDRPPGDPHQHVQFYQDGLPFGSNRTLLSDMIQNDDRLVALATKKLARQKRQVAAVVPEDTTDFTPQDVPDEDVDDDDDNDVNLEMWLTGEAKYIFGTIRATIADRYKKRGINNLENAVDFLVNDQRIVPADRLSPAFRAMLKKQDA